MRAVADPALAEAARAAQAKLIATLPERLQRQAMHAILMVYRQDRRPKPAVDPELLRQASWDERALDIVYADGEGRQGERRVFPLAIVFLEHAMVLLAWCCLREDFRQFRVDRIMAARLADASFRPRRVPLLREYIARLRDRRKECT